MQGKDRLRLRLIGELELAVSDAGGERTVALPASRKTRALIVYLLRCARPVRRERLCEIFFDIPDDPRAALRWSLSKIRSALGEQEALLVCDRERVELKGDGFVTDVDAMAAWAEGAPLPYGVGQIAERALDPALQGLELNGCDVWNAWLAAERAEIDRVRAAFLARVAVDERLTPQQRSLFAAEAKRLAAELEIELPVAAPPPPRTGRKRVAAAAPVMLAADEASPDQHVRYCFAADGVSIAYACTGEGPPLVKAANWLNHLELDWSGPIWGRLFHELSSTHTLIRYDERGNGLSDWDIDDLSFEAFVTDLATVVDTLELDRFPLLGISQGCAVSIEYAARHPERVSRLILLGGYAAGWRHTADADEVEEREAVITLVEHGWGEDSSRYRQIFSQNFMPSATPDEIAWFNDFQRRTACAANAARFLEAFSTIDVRHRLKELRCPTLVLHARGDQRIPMQSAIELASAIPNASLVTLETDNHIPLSREPATDRITECIRAFLREDETAATPFRRGRHAAGLF